MEPTKLIRWTVVDSRGNNYTIQGTSLEVSDGNVLKITKNTEIVAMFCGYTSIVQVQQ